MHDRDHLSKNSRLLKPLLQRSRLLSCVFLTLSLAFSPEIILAEDDYYASNLPRLEFGRVLKTAISESGASQDVLSLKQGASINAEIKGGEHRFFGIAITAGQYFHLLLQQHGIILSATLFDPTGRQIAVVNNPSGGHGPIYLSEIATVSGEYKLEVRSIEDWANPGSFDVSINELRASNPDDASRVDAERSFAKAIQDDEARSFDSAIEGFSKALSYWEPIRDPHWVSLIRYALAQTYRRSGKLKKEEEYLIESLKIEVDANDWRLRAAALNDLGFNRADSGNNEKALSLLGDALQLFEAHGDRRGQASSLNNLAITRARMGELRQARELAERALPLRIAENFQSGVNNLRNTLGLINDKLGDPFKALEYQTQALAGWQQLAQAKQLDSPNRLANAFNSVALATEKVGNLDQARQYYDDALNIPGIGAGIRAAILNNKGELYASLADFDTAMTSFTEARALLDSLENPDRDLKASLLLQIGQVHASTGELDEAIQQFQQARETKPNDPKLAYVHTALGDAWSRKGNLTEALKAYEAALKLNIQDRRSQALTRQKLGEAYALSGDTGAASKEYEGALSLWRAVIDPRGEAATLNSFALLERERGNLSEALQRSEQATSILESLRTSISSHQLRTSYFASREDYYELNIDLNMMLARSDQSDQHIVAALLASERSHARSLVDTLTEARADITEGVSEDNLRLAREVERKLRAKLNARTLLLSTKHNESEASTISREVSDLIRQQDEVRSKIRAGSPRYSQLIQPQLLTVIEIQKQLDAETVLVEYALGEKRSYVWVVTPNSINGFELPSRDKIEQMARRVAEALTARNREAKNESFPQKQMRIDKAEEDYSEAATALSKIVLAPVYNLLGQKRVVVVADGTLQLIPFAALPPPANAATAASSTRTNPRAAEKPTTNANSTNIAGTIPMPLIAQHEIITLPSASVLALQRSEFANRKPAPLAVAVLADPVFDREDVRVAKATDQRNQDRKNAAALGRAGTTLSKPGPPTSAATSRHVPQTSTTPLGSVKEESVLMTALRDVGLGQDGRLSRLTHSRQEAIAIARAVSSGQSLNALDFKASRETATSPALSQYRIIHFATHGVLDLEHPELSGIVLSMVNEKGEPQDGYLRLHDIYNLNLPAELVVLSACQTGIGKQVKGEGLIALTRGFMYAGTKSVVASLWKVDDAATSALMAEFYKQMFTNKLKPAAALREAQIKVSRQNRWRSPYYWAGFFIQGEWN